MLLFQSLNGIRQQMWLETNTPQRLMQMAREVCKSVGHYAWLVAGFNLRVGPATQLADTAVIRERLGYGQVVVCRPALGRRLVSRREGRGQDSSPEPGHALSPDIVRASALVSAGI